ncbi:hypothetical protein BOTBODRAFT_147679 [Botryobasidium botryosum FD-172 SS1]|uniref:Major facilitator superfamily (MFS) profile domain-containing protein n=1 Tax=Botryobasidium botryosum (strain FD-172 SS1) TaxID=930990 RepID=A0A067M6Y2_BOTB1|nr:hypothetical protein BOTBODRAFT_147679 [Botryobasidium botryosum FD-172 SS1]
MADNESGARNSRPSASFFHEIYDGIGLHTFVHSSADTKLLLVQRFIRIFAYGQSTLILALFFKQLGWTDARKGVFMTTALFVDVPVAFLMTLFADSLGRRRTLRLAALMMTGGGVAFVLASNYWVLLIAATAGLISPSGTEVGPFRAIEESTIAHLTAPEVRSDIYGWYSLIGAVASALGSLSCGWIVYWLQKNGGLSNLESYRTIYAIYTCLSLAQLAFTFFLSPACEARESEKIAADDSNPEEDSSAQTPLLAGRRSPSPPPEPPKIWGLIPRIAPESRAILFKLSLLIGFDSVASGIASKSWVTYWFSTTYSVPQNVLGTIFFVASILTAFSGLAALPVAKRIGPVKTMVFGHLPSAVLLGLVPIFPTLAWAVMCYILRACFLHMDVAPRSAFVSAILLPGERTTVMGWLNVVKTCCQAVGPSLTGWLASTNHFGAFFIISGTMKTIYDLLILVVFSRVKTDRQGNRLWK